MGKLSGCRVGLGERIITTAREVALTTRSPIKEVVDFKTATSLESACCCRIVEKLPMKRLHDKNSHI